MATSTLKICYSGSLNAYFPKKEVGAFKRFFLDIFWTFNNKNIDASTRSAYYLILAVKYLKEQHNILPNQLSIELWGDIHTGNIQQINSNGVEAYFEIGSYLPKEVSLKKLSNSDLLFLPLEKSNTLEHQTLFIPGKLFEYLNTGKPILALCEPSDCRTILENSGLVICVDPDNVILIANCLLTYINQPELLQQYKPNSDYIEQYSFVNKTKELAQVFDQFAVSNSF